MNADAKGSGEDARRLREFTAFDSILGRRPEASRPSSTAHLDVRAMAADS